MIGVVGVAIIAADLIRSPLLVVFYLAGLVLMVCWILLMAVVDLLSTQTYLREARKRRLAKKGELEAEVRRLRKLYRGKDDGQAPK